MHKSPIFAGLGNLRAAGYVPCERLRVVSILHHHIDTLPACTPVPQSVRLWVWPEARPPPPLGAERITLTKGPKIDSGVECSVDKLGVEKSAQKWTRSKGGQQ